MSNSSEAIELWAAFKKGDRQAFNGLVTIFYESLYRYGARLSADHRMVEDCLQDLFLDLWRRREFIAETEHVKFYLLKALRRKIYSEKKTRDKWIDVDADIEHQFEFIGEFSAESTIILSETNELHARKLQEVLSRLSKRQREAIYLRFYQEMDNEQISNLMSINYQSVRNLIHTAIRDLQSAWFAEKD